MSVKTDWIEDYCLTETLQILSDLATEHLRQGGVIGSHLLTLLKARDWAGLVNYSVDHTADWDVLELSHVRQGLGFFQKLEDLDIGVDKDAVALVKFLESERDCRATNDFLRQANGAAVKLPSVVRLLETVRRKIRFVLGVCPKADNLRLHFGPGATTVIKRKAAVPEAKFASGFQCSTSMLASGLLPTYLRCVPHWLEAFAGDTWIDEDDYIVTSCEVTLVPGTLTCVPKSAKTSRTILVEPNLNGLVQQGIRHAMEKRLEKAGLATRDQQRNADMARRGSISNDLATLDLSSASDLISYELVKLILPADWFSLLCSARTGAAQLPDKSIVALEKFSSMGNAYTFPLETLIFWAISMSAAEVAGEPFPASDVAVYGDDIIVPSRGYKHVVWGLNCLGFKLNLSKSFPEGPFRESCGADYYRGFNIRPYYQKHLVSGRTLFSLHNFYVRHSIVDMAERVKNLIPRPLRLYGPEGYGDGHLLSDTWPRRRKTSWLEKGYCGVSFDTFSLGSVRKIARYPGDWVSPLYSVYMSDRVRMHELVPVCESPAAVRFAKDGRPYWTYPGSEGYKRVSIYTLDAG